MRGVGQLIINLYPNIAYFIEVFEDEVKRAVSTLEGLLHLTVVTGVIVCVFAVPYSPLAVSIYGGDLLSKNSGRFLLQDLFSN